MQAGLIFKIVVNCSFTFLSLPTILPQIYFNSIPKGAPYSKERQRLQPCLAESSFGCYLQAHKAVQKPECSAFGSCPQCIWEAHRIKQACGISITVYNEEIQKSFFPNFPNRYSWPFIFTGYASMDSTNHGRKIIKKKIPESSKKQNLNVLATIYIAFSLHYVLQVIQR